MPVSSGYLEYVLDQLSSMGTVTHKRMFGGIGLYFDGLFFGLIDDDVLYFKVDDSTRPKYEAAGAKPFNPYEEPLTKPGGYYSVLTDVLEDQDQLKAAGKEAVEVARRKAASKKPRSSKKK